MGIHRQRAFVHATLLALVFAEWINTSSGQSTERVSINSAGIQGNGPSYDPMVTPDARYVAFRSAARNLVGADFNGKFDIFLRDRSLSTTQRVSVDSLGNEGNGDSQSPSISADGSLIAFTSYSTNLVSGDTNGARDAFVHDSSTGTTERVSVDSSGAQANAFTNYCILSADGSVVTFDSGASNLVSGDTNGTNDVFVHDRVSGLTERVSVSSAGVEGDGQSGPGGISSDGRIVVFFSLATNLVSGDTNGTWDVFVRDRVAGTTERVSVDSTGVGGNDASYNPVLSPDGLLVSFASAASNLVPGDSNGFNDVFVHDRSTGLTTRVSIDSSGAEGNSDSYSATISGDGNAVAFSSDATNLVPADSNRRTDVFVHDLFSGRTELVSMNSAGHEGNDDSAASSLSADGQFVAFSSNATNLVPGDTNSAADAFLRDRGPAPPVVLDVTPGRSRYDTTADVTIHGAYFLNGTGTQVLFGSGAATNPVVVDDQTITCTTPAGEPGPCSVTVQNSVGSDVLDAGFDYTPAVLIGGNLTPGGDVSITYLCDPLDGIFAIAGLPPPTSIPTPPFHGDLCIAPYSMLFLYPTGIWPFDHFDLNWNIPNDPSLSGVQFLLQALIGSSFGRPKDAAWTNCAVLSIH